jgi:hypothetical protein
MIRIKSFLEWLFVILAILFWPIVAFKWAKRCWRKKDHEWKHFVAFGIIGSCALIDLAISFFVAKPLLHSIPSGLLWLAGCILQFNLIMRKKRDEGLFKDKIESPSQLYL